LLYRGPQAVKRGWFFGGLNGTAEVVPFPKAFVGEGESKGSGQKCPLYTQDPQEKA
jgi:hypothetical protein